MKKLLDALVASLYLLAWRIVRWLPEKWAYRFFYALGRLLIKRDGKSVQRLRSNLARVKPDFGQSQLDELLASSMNSYLRYWCDTFRFPDWSSERVTGTVEVENEELLMQAIAAGTGVIVALPHAGNWDHAGAYFCSKGVKIVTVAERLKPEILFRKFLAYREAIGMEVLPLDSRSIATLAKRLREGGLVALVADRDLSKTGVTVDFFGGRARMPAGPAVLSINTEAPLVTAYVSYTPTGIHIDFRSIVTESSGTQQERVQRIVQLCADNFADGISEHPQDWHMLQRIWIDDDFKECEDD
ncbi:MAG: phosphatidylinositol mannoside acyltransferase [Candidatus Nanopelagicaceae bacterium]|nr:phosphatidylinositol mannoside acyltransferase [Candidatus Nanopelagicaceae bacterium]